MHDGLWAAQLWEADPHRERQPGAHQRHGSHLAAPLRKFCSEETPSYFYRHQLPAAAALLTCLLTHLLLPCSDMLMKIHQSLQDAVLQMLEWGSFPCCPAARRCLSVAA